VDIVDATSQLAILAEVVDTDEESLALARTVRVLEGIPVRGTMTELLGSVWRRVSRSGAMGGGRGRAERIAVRVKTSRGRIGRGRWLIRGPLGIAAPVLPAVASVAALLLVPFVSSSVAAVLGAISLRRRPRWRGAITSSVVASVTPVVLILAAAATAAISITSITSVLLGAIMALARVVRHDLPALLVNQVE
jgi:hypothetical protein